MFTVIVTVPADVRETGELGNWGTGKLGLVNYQQIENNLREKAVESQYEGNNLVVVFGPYPEATAVRIASRALRSLGDRMEVSIVTGARTFNPVEFS